MLTGGTGRTGERNVERRNRTDWRTECWLKEQSGMESGILTEVTELQIRLQEGRQCC